MDILYKNNQLIAFNKPANEPVQPDKTGDFSFLQRAEAYCKHPLHVVHRIDRPVSGILLMARSKAAMTTMSAQMKAQKIKRYYLAIVSQAPAQEEGTLLHFLRKNQQKNTVSAFETEQPNSDRAELRYRMLGSSERYFLLLIELHTGRHHQIRAQLSAIGCPIKGDIKYGARRNNPDHSIHLHAWKMEFEHPVSGDTVALTADLPKADPLWLAFWENTPFLQNPNPVLFP
ncbi:MAG: RNA pseudouridine synthase [Bacteroidetes bacterium]|nr:RNA pseudouridine synthase [Bacteroidota bacterium]